MVCSFSCRYNTGPVQDGLGGGQCVVRCHHRQKGGRRPGGWRCGQRWRRFLRRGDHNGRVDLGDIKPLRQRWQGAGGGITEGAEGGQQGGQEDVNPSIRFGV